jgi:hypothetical protein
MSPKNSIGFAVILLSRLTMKTRKAARHQPANNQNPPPP